MTDSPNITHDVYANTALTQITVVPVGNTVDGQTKIGSYTHPDTDGTDPLGPDVNHVLWHHIRDILYPLKQWNMQNVSISLSKGTPAVSGSISLSSIGNVAVGASTTITASLTNAGTNATIAWSIKFDSGQDGSATLTPDTTDQTKATLTGVTAGGGGRVYVTVTDNGQTYSDSSRFDIVAA